MDASIFKAYDIRGKVGTELTEGVAELVGKAFATWLERAGAIAVGRDMRAESADLAEALINGLRAQGRDVVDIGEVTTDMIYFTVGHFGYAGGAMVTASHNGAEYNGIKLCADEAKPVGLESGLDKVRDLAIKGDFTGASVPGTLEEKNVGQEWITHVLSFVDVSKLNPMKIAIDAGNGMAGSIVPLLSQKVPWEIIPMYFELDGSFPNHPANPMEPANLRDLQRMVKQEECDLGIAFDGDGDRAALVDEQGRAVSGSVTIAILAEQLLQTNPGGTVIYDVRTSRMVPEVVETNGGHSVRTKVGGASIKEEMRRHNAPLGGEASGHFYFRDNWYADSGLISEVIAVSIVGQSGMKLSELVDKYQKYVSIPETNFQVENKQAVMKQVEAMFPEGEADWLDGLTVSFPDAWFNIRASNTEPLLRLNVEAHEPNRLNGLVSKLSDVLSNAE